MTRKSNTFRLCPIMVRETKFCKKLLSLINSPKMKNKNKNNKKFNKNTAALLCSL